ncbi:MAG: sigma-70 family RNA polymerase sigma factor [Pirellulaceae bacterium]|nr:sigma-70 family RNA polymerase sigma factor [Pirellulaceae bacterium]
MSPNPPDSDAEDDAPSWPDVFEACKSGLTAFLRGRLRQEADVEDCLQVVWMKMSQAGGEVSPAARRAWLFRVAANESARIWRSHSTTKRVLEKQADNLQETTTDRASDKIIDRETAERLRAEIEQLPETTQQILRLRIDDNLTFQQIADQLNLPLGTTLSRMRRALDRLRSSVDSNEE